jgi:hypothetical protein
MDFLRGGVGGGLRAAQIFARACLSFIEKLCRISARAVV